MITLTIAVALTFGQSLVAVASQVPSPLSSLFLQTSGPNAGITIGDYYTAPAGGNTDHLFIVRIPADWPAGIPVTVALYDPELAGPDPSSPTAADEVRGSADSSSFRLESPAGATIVSTTYSTAASNGKWVELATFDPGVSGTGTYQLHVTVSNDDDNSFRIDASHDPDCAVGGPGTCPTALLVNGNETDQAPGGSGKLGLGVVRTSYQHAGSGLVCQDHIFYVNSSTPRPLRSHNFDMDNNGSVTYKPPTGGSITGTVSGNGVWNNSTTATRAGDILPDINGWWTATICISSTNQYVFEAPSAGPSFPEPQPAPRLTVTKSDGVATAGVGDDLTYSITVDNVSDTDPVPGSAYEIVVSDELPDGVTFVTCSAPAGAVCTETGGLVTVAASSPLAPGEAIVVEVTVTVGPDVDPSLVNTATVSYEDGGGSGYEDVEASDIDAVDFEPTLLLEVTGPVETLRGQDVNVSFALSHGAASDGSAVATPTLDCAACASLTFIGGDDDNDGLLDDGETWTWAGVVPTGPGDPDPLPVVGAASGVDRNGEEVTATATHWIDLVEEARIRGTVYEDLDGDGVYDAGEPVIEAAAVGLGDGSGPIGSTSTGPAGGYVFDQLLPGGYEVTVETASVPSDMTSTSPTAISVTLAEGETSDGNDFGFARPVIVSGTVFHDADRDGAQGVGETGLEGVVIEISGEGGTISATTGPDGGYSFTLMPGTFVIVIDGGLPQDWDLTTDDTLSTGQLLSGGSSTGNDFGVAAPISIPDDDGDDDGGGTLPPPQDPDEGATPVDVLPFTGMDMDRLLVIGLSLLAMGGLVIGSGGDRREGPAEG